MSAPAEKQKGAAKTSRIPIKITGNRSNPTFGLDVRRVFKRS